uniref:GATA zinc finger domain-containing protein 16 n=1 Tax=Erigeron canadensis TaxID=72917 RepID=UPI001CB8A5D6|nr:GATA zinc finger domain-containing protein 16 [Erigeron canadensis]
MHTSDLGDHIGMESSVDLETNIQPSLCGSKVAMNRKPCEASNRRTSGTRKELPPPLPIQTATVMRRYYTNDKRLVITEEKVESPRLHFIARRSHGRLTIQLVNNNNNNNNNNDNNININELNSKDDLKNVNENVVNNNNDVVVDGGSCYGYNTANVRVAAMGPCLFINQNQLHAIRPLQI